MPKPATKQSKPQKKKAAMPKPKSKIPPKLVTYLEKAGVDHQILEHKTVYSAIDAALTLKRKFNEIAKTLLIKADKDYYLIILPADLNLDFDRLAKLISKFKDKDVRMVKIPGEEIMGQLLRIKNGTVSAFGSLHKLTVFADKSLTKIKKAVFASGSFNHSIEMATEDFIKLENAVLGSFGVKKKIIIQKPKVKARNTVSKSKIKNQKSKLQIKNKK